MSLFFITFIILINSEQNNEKPNTKIGGELWAKKMIIQDFL